jgi:radical SAM superfamily enzyme YgiQ (UPF0313 family)
MEMGGESTKNLYAKSDRKLIISFHNGSSMILMLSSFGSIEKSKVILSRCSVCTQELFNETGRQSIHKLIKYFQKQLTLCQVLLKRYWRMIECAIQLGRLGNLKGREFFVKKFKRLNFFKDITSSREKAANIVNSNSMRNMVLKVILIFFVIEVNSGSLLLASSGSLLVPVLPSAQFLQIAPELGSACEFYQGTSNKTIIFIQDAHDSLEAQENIAKIIGHFVESRGAGLVFEEGYDGPVPTDEYFENITEPQIRERVAYYLMNRLRISGAEYAHINREKDFHLIGIDNGELYWKNIAAFQALDAHREETERDLNEMGAAVDNLIRQQFPKEVKKWMAFKKRLNSGTLDFYDYLKRISWEQKKIGITGKTPDLDRLFSVGKMETRGTIKNIEAPDLAVLLKESQAFEEVFPADYLASETLREIFHFYETVQILKSLIRFQITAKEYEALNDSLKKFNTEKLADFLAGPMKQSAVLSRRWEASIRCALEFYEYVRARDKAVEEKLTSFASDPKSRTAVLVFGGFHSENLKSIFKNLEFSYVLITPRISAPSPKHQKYYHDLMAAGAQRVSHIQAIPQATRNPGDLMLMQHNPKVAAGFRSELRQIARSVGRFPGTPSLQEMELAFRKWPELVARRSPVIPRSESRAEKTPHHPVPTKVCLIGVGSPKHYEGWNNLSLETLAGDLRGEFPEQVNVSMARTNDPNNLDSVFSQVMSGEPDIIGISVQPGSLELVEALVKKFNEIEAVQKRKTMIVFGNQIPTVVPGLFIKLCPTGVVVRGEGEIALRGLVRVARGELSLSEVPSTVFQDENGKIVETPIVKPNLNELPHLPAPDEYATMAQKGMNVQVVASRGCPWGGCAFCTRTDFRRGGIGLNKGKSASWEGFPVEKVLANLDLVMSHGIREVEFSDDEFLGGREDDRIERIRQIAEGIKQLRQKYSMGLSFRIFTRPDIIFKEGDPDKKNEAIRQLLLQLKAVGLVRVFIGAEAGNEAQLGRYRRGMKLLEVTEAIKILKEIGLGVDLGFIMFDPELTIDEMLENVDFFRKNDFIKGNQWPFRPMVINHGSRMVERLSSRGLLGKENPNFMSYDFTFKDQNIANIAAIVDEISKKTAPIVYALKVKSKIFDPAKQDDNIRQCQKRIEENALLYLDLMEALGRAIQREASEDEMGAIVKRIDDRVFALAESVADDIEHGRIRDEDGYVQKELSRIGCKQRSKSQRPELRGRGNSIEEAIAQKNIPFSLYIDQKVLRVRPELRIELFALANRLQKGCGKVIVLTRGAPADLDLIKLYKGLPVLFRTSSQALGVMSQRQKHRSIMLLTSDGTAKIAETVPKGIVPFLLLEDQDIWAAPLLAVSDKKIPGIVQRNGCFQVAGYFLREQLDAFRSSLVVRIAA